MTSRKKYYNELRHEKRGGDKKIMKALHMTSYVLLWVGGLNWGMVGLFNYNLVEALLGSIAGAVQVVYILVGLAALYTLFTHKNYCKVCG